MWKKSLIVCTIAFGLLILSSCSDSTDRSVSSEKKITAFSVPGVVSTTITGNCVLVTVLAGTDVSALTPEITVSDGASIYPNSGETQDFTPPAVLYKVTAQDGSMTYYAVTVTTAKEIEEFSIDGHVGVITGTDIMVPVPYLTDPSSLTPTITISDGASVFPRSGVAQDFTYPVTYFVMAADGSIKMYAVTVVVGPANIATITSDDYTVSAGGTANETIIDVPKGVTRANFLLALNKGEANQTWVGTQHDPVEDGDTLVVTAQDGTTSVTYTITIPTKAIGESYQGGVVGYVLKSDDPGYVAGETHGLIAALEDQDTTAVWGCSGTSIGVTAQGTVLGTGQDNTAAIVGACSTAGIAARLCYDYSTGNNSDLNSWYLPSIDELEKLYTNRVEIGNFVGNDYWASSEAPGGAGSIYAYYKSFNGPSSQPNKTDLLSVRCVKSF